MKGSKGSKDSPPSQSSKRSGKSSFSVQSPLTRNFTADKFPFNKDPTVKREEVILEDSEKGSEKDSEDKYRDSNSDNSGSSDLSMTSTKRIVSYEDLEIPL